MSAKYTFLAWSTPLDNPPLKLALLQLANNSNDDGFSYYSISKMANSCGMSERTFMRKIAELEKLGMLIVERRTNRTSLYSLVGDEMGVNIDGINTDKGFLEVTESHQGVTESHLVPDSLSHDPKRDPKTYPNKKHIERNDSLEDGFSIFYSAGLVKKSKAQAFRKFKALVKQMDADPIEFGTLLSVDVQTRIAKQQFGIDKLHPSTYLNNQRWTDEHEESNNGQLAPNGKQSAAQRIAARNAEKYGQPSSGLPLAEGGGGVRRAMGSGEWGGSTYDMEV